MWVLLSLLSATGVAMYYALVKKFVQTQNTHVVAAITHLLTAAVFLTLVLSQGIPVIDPRFWFAMLATSIINVIAIQLLFNSLKTIELSLSSALFTVSPIVLLISSWVLLREVPTVIGLIGILIVVFSLYQLNIKPNQDFLAPFKRVFTTAGLRNTLIVALLFGVSSAYDKQTVVYSDPYFAGAVGYIILGVVFFLLSWKSKKDNTMKLLQKDLFFLCLAGVILAIASIAINIALTLQIASYVITLKRLSVIMSLIVGVLFFKEELTKRKVLSLILVWIGSVCIMMG